MALTPRRQGAIGSPSLVDGDRQWHGEAAAMAVAASSI
jgi:hypothetical protein